MSDIKLGKFFRLPGLTFTTTNEVQTDGNEKKQSEQENSEECIQLNIISCIAIIKRALYLSPLLNPNVIKLFKNAINLQMIIVDISSSHFQHTGITSLFMICVRLCQTTNILFEDVFNNFVNDDNHLTNIYKYTDEYNTVEVSKINESIKVNGYLFNIDTNNNLIKEPQLIKICDIYSLFESQMSTNTSLTILISFEKIIYKLATVNKYYWIYSHIGNVYCHVINKYNKVENWIFLVPNNHVFFLNQKYTCDIVCEKNAIAIIKEFHSIYDVTTFHAKNTIICDYLTHYSMLLKSKYYTLSLLEKKNIAHMIYIGSISTKNIQEFINICQDLLEKIGRDNTFFIELKKYQKYKEFYNNIILNCLPSNAIYKSYNQMNEQCINQFICNTGYSDQFLGKYVKNKTNINQLQNQKKYNTNSLLKYKIDH